VINQVKWKFCGNINCSIDGWGYATSRKVSQVRLSMGGVSLIFFNAPNPFSRTMAPGLTQPVTELSTGIFLGVNCGRRVRLTI
jgi:hypothetical protein